MIAALGVLFAADATQLYHSTLCLAQSLSAGVSVREHNPRKEL